MKVIHLLYNYTTRRIQIITEVSSSRDIESLICFKTLQFKKLIGVFS